MAQVKANGMTNAGLQRHAMTVLEQHPVWSKYLADLDFTEETALASNREIWAVFQSHSFISDCKEVFDYMLAEIDDFFPVLDSIPTHMSENDFMLVTTGSATNQGYGNLERVHIEDVKTKNR
jgi:hypothetical protein